jgi:hypothetical protein
LYTHHSLLPEVAGSRQARWQRWEGTCAHSRAAAGLNEYLYGIAEDLEQLNALDVGQSALCTP